MTQTSSDNTTPRRSVLMIACAFPPTGGSGVQRTAKFAKYLPKNGWTPIVWTRDRVPGLPRDERLGVDLPKDVIVHVAPGNVWDTLWDRARCSSERGGILAPFARRVQERLGQWLPNRRVPDDQIAWARRSVAPAARMIRTQGIRAIYSTFSPASNHWLALQLKRRTGLPWIADFRDLWTDDYRYSEASPHRRAEHRKLEQDVLETADAVIGVSRRQTEILASHVPSRHDRFVTITNGYDPADFKGVAKSVSRAAKSADSGVTFVLAHVGRLDRWRACEPLFEALADFVRSLGEDRKSIRVQLIGHADITARERFLTDRVPYRHVGYVDHGEAIRAMASADALLLTVPDGPNAESVIPAKLFEYLASGRPILSVGPFPGETQSIVDHCRGGAAVGFRRAEILAALYALHDDWRENAPRLMGDPRTLIPFQRDNLAARLAAVLESVVDGDWGRLRELAADPGYETNPSPMPPSRRTRATQGVRSADPQPALAEVNV